VAESKLGVVITARDEASRNVKAAAAALEKFGVDAKKAGELAKQGLYQGADVKGLKNIEASFKRLGLSTEQARAKMKEAGLDVTALGEKSEQAAAGVKKVGLTSAEAQALLKRSSAEMKNTAQNANTAKGKATELSGALTKTGQSASAAGKNLSTVSNAVAGLGSRIGAAVAGIAAFSAVSRAFDGLKSAVLGFNGQMEQSRIAWTTMLKSADAADVMLRELQRFAAGTPFEFPELEASSKRLLAMGFAAKDIIPIMTDIGNASAALGGGTEGVNRIVTALGQMRAKGKVSAEEMNQLAEMGVPAWQMLADATGKPIPVLMELAKQGEVTANTMISAFRRYSAENWGGMMDQQSRTFLGALSTIRDNVTQTAAGAFRPLFDQISGLAQRIAAFTSSAQFSVWADQVASAVTGVINLIGRIPGPVQEAIAIFGALAVAVAGIAGVVAIAGPAIAALTGPIGLVIAAAAGLYAAWRANFLGIRDAVAKILPVVEDIVFTYIGAVVAFFDENLPKIAEIVGAVLKWIEEAWTKYGDTLLDIAEQMFAMLKDAFGFGVQATSEVLSAGLDAMSGDWEGFWGHVTDLTFNAWMYITRQSQRMSQMLLDTTKAMLAGLGQPVAGNANLAAWQASIDNLVANNRGLAESVGLGGANDWSSDGYKYAQGATTAKNAARDWARTIIDQLLPARKQNAEQYEEEQLASERAQRMLAANKVAVDIAAKANEDAAGALDEAGKKAKDAGISVSDLTQALVANSAITRTAAVAVTYWESQIEATNLAIEANRDQLQAAQSELSRMQDHLSELNDELTIAKQKFDEFSHPTLSGMGAFADQIFEAEQAIKRLQLAELNWQIAGGTGDSPFKAQIEAAQRDLQRLQLEQSLTFDPQMRSLDKLANPQTEMTYQEAAAGIQEWGARVADLTKAVEVQEKAIKGQEAVVKSIQAAADALNKTLAIQQEQLELARGNFENVTKALTAAFTWFLTDREEIAKLGPEGAKAAGLVDEETKNLLLALTGFAADNTTQSQQNIAQMVKDYEDAVNRIKAMLNGIGGPGVPNIGAATGSAGGYRAVVNGKVVYDGPSQNAAENAYNDAGGGAFGEGSYVEKHDYPGPAYAGRTYKIGTEEYFTPFADGYIAPIGGASAPGGAASPTIVHVHVAGSVVSEGDLVEAVHAGLLRKRARSGSLGLS
jgi:tape measure domain-containing protein